MRDLGGLFYVGLLLVMLVLALVFERHMSGWTLGLFVAAVILIDREIEGTNNVLDDILDELKELNAKGKEE